MKIVRDEWIWKDETTLVRVHNTPRRRMFVPKEADFLPCKLKRFRDDRETYQVFQSSGRTINDSWRLAGNNIERTNRRNEFWTGTTTFKIISNADIDNLLDSGSDVEDRASCQNSVVTCTFDGNMKIIPLDDMFIAHQYKLKHETRKNKDWDIQMILHRKNGTTWKYHFRRSSCDFVGEFLNDTVICLELHELTDETPCLLLMCAETQSIMTKIHRKDRFKLMHIVTITEDDNLMSNFGRAKWRRCIRSASDCVFFAGPCTGGSPWNRLNKNVSDVTAHNIRMKAQLYWELWEEFSLCLQRVHEMYAMALLELPRGCDYWNDERMKFMVNGTSSTIHEFDGCMYGLKSQFKDAGTAIKKPWRIVSWGVSFSDLHEKCDGSHSHGPCAGRETRATQLYTDKIVRCIIRGVKNQMLWNIAYGTKQPKKVNNKMNTSKPRNKACTCLAFITGEDEDSMNQHCGQLLLDWIRRRGGLKVKLRSNPHRGRSVADPDSPLVGILDAMAEKKIVTVSAAKGYAALKNTLQVVEAKGQTGQLPKAFPTFDEADGKFYPDRDLGNWITVVQVPPSVVVALAFVAGRIHRSHVSHAIHLLLKLMMQVTDEDELNLTVSDFVDKASRLSKLVERGARGDDYSFLRMLCTRECAIRIDEFWETLKSQYSGTNNMINRTVTVRQLREKISNTSIVNMGSLNQSHPPGNSICHQIRLRAAWFPMTRVYWEKWAFHVMEREKTSMNEIETRAKTLWEILEGEGANLGYALRRHNAKMHQANAPGQSIIIQDVLEDWVSMRYDLTLERTAAVIHLQTMLMASAMLHEWVSKMETFKEMHNLRRTIQNKLKTVKGSFDLRSDIWEVGGYNVASADQGSFDAIEKRNRTFSCIRDFITTTSASQVAQGVTEIEHIDNWNIPLLPKDGRYPPAQGVPPTWDPHPIVMMNQQQSAADDERRRAQAGPAPPPPPEPKARPTPTGGDASSSAGATGSSAKPPPKARPRPPDSPPDWVISEPPIGYKLISSSCPDHRGT